MAKPVATIDPRAKQQCCPSVLASPLDASQAAELASWVHRLGRPGPTPTLESARRRARWRGVRV